TMNDSRRRRKGRGESSARARARRRVTEMKRRIGALLWLLPAVAGCGGQAEERPPVPAPLSPEALSLPQAESAPSSPAADPDVPAGAPLVIFLGDSITAGLHVEPRDAYPAVVQRALAAGGVPFRLVNAGVSGDTSAGGLRRLDWLLKQHPDVLVLELGGNDGLRGQPVREIEA